MRTTDFQILGRNPLQLDTCTQELILQPTGALRRTINGRLVHTGHPETKYKVRIQGIGPWPIVQHGEELEFHSFQRITGQREHLSRPAVPESLCPLENGLVSYRPILRVRVVSFSCIEIEWEKGSEWTLVLEEI